MRCSAFLALGLVALPSLTWCQEDPPALVALTLDTSGSIGAELIEQTRALAVSILEALPQGSEVALFVFDDSSRLILERTDDPEAVREALAGVQRAGRYTALYDALYDASRYLQAAPRSRKAIVLVTDGKDENSTLLQEDGLRVATEARIPVFAVGVGRIQEAVLSRIAKLTGGRFSAMGQVNGEQIASQVTALEPSGVASTPMRPTAVAAPPPPPPPIRGPLGGFPGNLLILFGVVLLGVIAVAVALIVRLRPEAPPDSAGRARSQPAGSHAGRPVQNSPGASLELDSIDRTIVLRGLPALRVTSGPAAGRVLELTPGRTVSIGRDSGSDLEVADGSVSALHCRVIPDGDGFVICDIQSTNGTRVNGERIERQRLREGDVITIGGVRMTFGRA
jgi:hypothetical protein